MAVLVGRHFLQIAPFGTLLCVSLDNKRHGNRSGFALRLLRTSGHVHLHALADLRFKEQIRVLTQGVSVQLDVENRFYPQYGRDESEPCSRL
jgi:hypothetical protein